MRRVAKVVSGWGALMLVGTTLAGADSRAAQSPEDKLTKAKLDADLGNYEAALAGLTELAASSSASAPLRAEALVRLGAVRGAMGDAKGGIEAFARALREHGDDEAAVRLLVLAVGGVVPGEDVWVGTWRRLQLGVDVTDAERPSTFIRWPSAPWAHRRLLDPEGDKVVRFVLPARRLYTGDTISLDFKNGDLGDIFRLFADISGLNVVVNPGTHGTVTLRVTKQPWDDVLDRMLSANGLAFQVKGPVLHIGKAEDLGPAGQKFTGRPIDLDFHEKELVRALRAVATMATRRPLPPGFETSEGVIRVEVSPKVTGHVTLKLVQVPWDQAFDILARVNGLRWKRQGDVIRVGFPEDLQGL